MNLEDLKERNFVFEAPFTFSARRVRRRLEIVVV